MKVIRLNAIPNQTVIVSLDDVRWQLTIKQARSMMICDVMRNDRDVIRGTRIIANAPIIPFAYLSQHGHFALLTENDELPWWEKFTTTQTLVYWSTP